VRRLSDPPAVLIATVWPAIGFELPGFTMTVVTPPASARSKPGSSMFIASIARTPAVLGMPDSFVSAPGSPIDSSWMPM
jgi:hypothetical protein